MASRKSSHRESLSRLRSRSSRRALALAAASAGVFGTLQRANAATGPDTWTGATNAWATGSNWTGSNTPPVSNDSLVFGAAGAGGLNLNNNLTTAAFNVAGITFNSGAGAFVIGDGTTNPNVGNAFALTGNITNNSGSLETINNAFTLSSAGILTGNTGNITIGGNMTAISGLSVIKSTNAAGLITLGNLTQTAGSGATVAFTTTGTIKTTTVDTANGIIGGWAVIDNGNSTFSWAHSGASGTNNITAAAATTAVNPPGATSNWLVSGSNGALTGNATVNTLIETKDINTAGFRLTIGSGGIILQGNNFWMQGGGSLTTGLASGELFVHSPDPSQTDEELFVPIVNGTAGTVILVKDGPGQLDLAANNTYTGSTIINGGAVSLNNTFSHAGNLGSVNNTLTINSGALDLGFAGQAGISLGVGSLNGTSAAIITNSGTTAATLTVGNNDASGTYAGIIKLGTSDIALAKSGTGNLTLSNFNTFTGGTTVNGGNLTLAAGSGAGTVRGNLTINSGATVNLAAQDALGYNNDASRVSSVFINGGTLNNTSGASNGYLTNFTLTGGTMSSTDSTNGYYRFNTGGYGITSLASSTTSVVSAPLHASFTANVPINVAGGSTSSGVDLRITGTIFEDFGAGSIGKSGTGLLVLSGSNLYSGGTTISAGTLRANNTSGSATGSGNISVLAGSGNYTGGALGGNGTVTGSVTLALGTSPKYGGIITAGADAATIGKLTTGNETWNSGAAYQWKINTPGDGTALLGNRTTISANTTAGGNSTGSGYDLLQVGGNLSSGSLLSVNPTNGSTVFTIEPIGNITVTFGKTYNWTIAQIGTTANTRITLNGNATPTSPSSTTALNPSIFALDTSNLIVNGSSTSSLLSPGNFSLYFEAVGSNNDLVLSYDATPEPGTALLVLSGTIPMLKSRRRHKATAKNNK